MFSNLVSYLVGSSSEGPVERVEPELTDVRLTQRESEDDWVLVDRDSEGNSEAPSDECLDERLDELLDVPHGFGRSSSNSSIPFTNMEESWFITPPPSFTSSGPIQLETSPFENLLIEHPSMSVYHQHPHPMFVNARLRHNIVPAPQTSGDNRISEMNVVAEALIDDDIVIEEVVVHPNPRRNHVENLRQQERQKLHNKQAQKVTIQFIYQLL